MQRRQRQRQEQEKLVRQQQERRYPWTSTSLSAWRLSDVSNVTLPTSKPQLHQRQMDGWETQRMQNKASSKNQRQDTWNEQRYVRSDKWSEIGWSGGRAPDCRCCRPQTYHCCEMCVNWPPRQRGSLWNLPFIEITISWSCRMHQARLWTRYCNKPKRLNFLEEHPLWKFDWLYVMHQTIFEL